MYIAPTLQRYLTAEDIEYDVIPHDPTMSSARTAEWRAAYAREW
jgi:Ala-tRNA(Pro) deacylase